MQYENLFTEAQVEERVESEKEEALRLVVEDFKVLLQQKDEKIYQLESSVKSLSQHSPISRASLYQIPEFNHELRLQQEKIKQHYSSEVQRVVANLQRDVFSKREIMLTSPGVSDDEHAEAVLDVVDKRQYQTQQFRLVRNQTEDPHRKNTSLDVQWDKLV